MPPEAFSFSQLSSQLLTEVVMEITLIMEIVTRDVEEHDATESVFQIML